MIQCDVMHMIYIRFCVCDAPLKVNPGRGGAQVILRIMIGDSDYCNSF